MYPEIFWRYHLPKILDFNISALPENALRALPSHFKFKQTFAFLLFWGWGAIVWVPILHLRYQNPAGYITGLNDSCTLPQKIVG